MRKRGKHIALIFITGFLITYFFIKPSYSYLTGYLSKSKQVKANVLIIEGWIPEFALNSAYEEFHKNGYDYIITTGLKSPTSYLMLSDNGYLIFYPGDRFSNQYKSEVHKIEVDAYSELGGDNRSHFNLFVNDSLSADFYAEKNKKKYSIKWTGSLNRIDSLMLQFTNEDAGDFGARNLYVKEIVIDKKIRIPYLYNSEFAPLKSTRKARIINDNKSNAVLAKNWLSSKGIDSALIIAVPGGKARINRTLTSALAVRDWLKQADIKINGINIISLGTHSRRTWMTYKRILNEKYEIGIISIPDRIYSHSKEIKVLNTIRETLDIIYYWFLLIPY
jgi:hypothetical protein